MSTVDGLVERWFALKEIRDRCDLASAQSRRVRARMLDIIDRVARDGRGPAFVAALLAVCPTPAKVSYPTRADVESDVRRRLEVLRANGATANLAGYRCRCGAYHLTSKVRAGA